MPKVAEVSRQGLRAVARRSKCTSSGQGRRPVRRSSVQVLRRSQCEECAIMDNEGRFSLSAQALYSRLGTELAPIIVDVRRNLAFEADDTVIEIGRAHV